MKKICYTLVMLLMASVTSFAADDAKIILQHNGQAKIYDGSQLAEAINDAEEGKDTLYLSEGSFGELKLTKRLLVRGSGVNTVINGDIAISATGTCTTPILEGLYTTGTVYVNSILDNMIIKHVSMEHFSLNAKVSKATVRQCYIRNTLKLNAYCDSLSLINTKIYYLDGASTANNKCNFLNCNIFQAYWERVAGVFVNCIISAWWSYEDRGGGSISNSLLSYSVYNSRFISIAENSIQNDCIPFYANNHIYIDGRSAYPILNYIDCESLYAPSEQKWFGSDNTEIGIYGGNKPYTLVPAVPRITDKTITVDSKNNKLKVSFSVTAQ